MLPATIAERAADVKDRIALAAARVGRRSEEITLVAVSKTQPAEAIREAISAGLTTFGENRVQEWETKRPSLADLAFRCHLIGHLQSNKAKKAAAIFDRVDSVDSPALALKLDAAAKSSGAKLGVLIEVHLGEEKSKTGVSEADLDALVNVVRGCFHLDLHGLMTVPPFAEDVEAVRPHFRKLRELRDALRTRTGLTLNVLSMGMSHDFEVAIEEGATEVRVGSAIFGAREVK
jgi:pyridoxal phosphate enzyme (YggS family)